jgi:hypothetical protein
MPIGSQISQDILVLFQALKDQANIHHRFGFNSRPSPGHWPAFSKAWPFPRPGPFQRPGPYQALTLAFARFQNQVTKTNLEPKLHVCVVDMPAICRHETAMERSDRSKKVRREIKKFKGKNQEKR